MNYSYTSSTVGQSKPANSSNLLILEEKLVSYRTVLPSILSILFSCCTIFIHWHTEDWKSSLHHTLATISCSTKNRHTYYTGFLIIFLKFNHRIDYTPGRLNFITHCGINITCIYTLKQREKLSALIAEIWKSKVSLDVLPGLNTLSSLDLTVKLDETIFEE